MLLETRFSTVRLEHIFDLACHFPHFSFGGWSSGRPLWEKFIQLAGLGVGFGPTD